MKKTATYKRRTEIRKEILNRVLWAQGVLNNPAGHNLQEAIEDLARWIAYFQHERHVHLMVTGIFAILAMMSVILLVLSPSLSVIVLILLMVILLLFYIAHYYLLENRTQLLYAYMDKFIELARQQKNGE